MDEPSRPLNERAEQYAHAVRAVMKDVGPQLRGMHSDEAEERLVAALQKRDVFVPPGMVRTLARTAADPWGDFKHPLKAARLRRENARQSDTESQRAQAEVEEIHRRIEAILDSVTDVPFDWSFTARPTYDGMTYVIVLHRYSDALAEHIRSALEPIQVEVRRGT